MDTSMKEKANSDLNNCIHNDLDVSMDDRGLVEYCVAHVKVEISETRGFCDVELKKYIKSYVHYNICIVFILTNLQRKTSKLLSVFPARPQPPTGFFSRTTTGNNNKKKKTHTDTNPSGAPGNFCVEVPTLTTAARFGQRRGEAPRLRGVGVASKSL